jgi:uncharacterized membrane protein YdjX (TVP38/TMEM64 family)
MPQQPPLLAPAAALAALLAVLLLALPSPAEAFSLADGVASLEGAIAAAGPWGPALFILAYVAAAVLFVPGSLLTVAAGFLFGPLLGSAVVSIAATAGAAAAFLVGRYLARPAVEARVAAVPKFAAVDAAIGAQGAWIILLLRLSPLFPYTLLNYALSLTAIEFWPYVGASWAGMLPGTVAYVALGGAGKAAAESAAGGGGGAAQVALAAVGAAATLGATVLVSRAAGRALAEAEAAQAAAGEAAAEGAGGGREPLVGPPPPTGADDDDGGGRR